MRSRSFLVQKAVSRVFFRLSQFVACLVARPEVDKRVIILPPAGPGSSGDQAMVWAAAQKLQKNGISRIGVVRYSADDFWGGAEDVFSFSVNWPKKNLIDWIFLAIQLRRSSHFFVLGADVLDGKYGYIKPWRMLLVADLARTLGVDSRICGFSLNEQPAVAMKRAFADLHPRVRCYLRDPVSAERFYQITGRRGHRVADLAFLLEPAQKDSIAELANWIHAWKESGQFVLGVNLNYLPFSDQYCNGQYKGREQEITQTVAQNMESLLRSQPNLAAVFVPHDNRGRWSDEWFVNEVFSALSEDVQGRCIIVRKVLQANEIKSIAGMLDGAITGRMHFLIALLGSGVPALGVTYQGKFQGLYQLFHLDGLTITPDDLLSPKLFSDALEHFLNDIENLKLAVAEHLLSVKHDSLFQLQD